VFKADLRSNCSNFLTPLLRDKLLCREQTRQRSIINLAVYFFVICEYRYGKV